MSINGSKLILLLSAAVPFLLYTLTAPQNHSEAEDVYDFALKVEQGTFAEQAGVNRVLALPVFGAAYKTAQAAGYSGRAFPFLILINRILAVGCVLLFWKMTAAAGQAAPVDKDQGADGKSDLPFRARGLLPIVFLFAFSYGFWRYANEAETYVLAGFLVLGAWYLALRGRGWWSIGVSAFGVLVHLLNLIPLLLIIPLYYLLSRDWKRALLHGLAAGLLTAAVYAVCSPWLDFSELGAQHHAAEGGLGLKNGLRGMIAFGQCLVSANFLFGFDAFRSLLSGLFPSRMLGEEFYMASHMPGWIPGFGAASAAAVLVCGAGCLVQGVRRWRRRGASAAIWTPFSLATVVWLLLYAGAVIRTESGSPELWIMALIPFWLLAGVLLSGAGDFERNGKGLRVVWCWAAALCLHNLAAGLLPVMPAKSDYHAQKSKWLVENARADDLILTSYEPILIFYLNYFAEAEVLVSSRESLEELDERLGLVQGKAYAVNTFFQPLNSMLYRSPEMYERMALVGERLRPRFELVEQDEFGGIHQYKRQGEE